MTRAVAVGRIVRAHGVRGEVVVRRFGDTAGVLDRGRELRTEMAGHEVTLAVAAARPHHGGWLVTFEGVSDRNAAEALVGVTLTLSEDSFPPLGEGAYYHFELVGFEVVTVEEEPLGTVEAVLETGANDVLEVQGPRGEVLLPMIEPVVEKIDREHKRILVRLIPGLVPEKP